MVSPRRDDRFAFRGRHETIPVLLTARGFQLPAGLPTEDRSAVLSLTLEARGWGRLQAPFIEVESRTVSYRQYFERGAVGRRYLNLSPLFQGESAAARGPDPDRVIMRGGAIAWHGDASLSLFEPPPLFGAKVLVLAPHPDDAELAAYGLYAGRTPSPWVVTLTTGEHGSTALTAMLPQDARPDYWKARLRVWDSLVVPQLGGVNPDRCLNLAYPDGQLVSMRRQPTATFRLACEDRLSRDAVRARNLAPRFRSPVPACSWRGLVSDLRAVLDEAQPDVIVCPHPLIDAHDDHKLTAAALDEALGAELPQPSTILLYAIHVRAWRRYPFGPPESVASLPPWNERAWTADGLYSHPLCREVQRAKYFAIEATHDSHRFDLPDTSFRRLPRAAAQRAAELLGTLAHRSDSFLRRGPRPNELYYVASRLSFAELVERALDDADLNAPSTLRETADQSSG